METESTGLFGLVIIIIIRLKLRAQPTHQQQTFWMLWVVGQLPSRTKHKTRLSCGNAFISVLLQLF